VCMQPGGCVCSGPLVSAVRVLLWLLYSDSLHNISGLVAGVVRIEKYVV
jgi:hypothetical protein